MTHTWPDVLTALVGGHDLTAEQATWAMGQVLAGEASPSRSGHRAMSHSPERFTHFAQWRKLSCTSTAALP